MPEHQNWFTVSESMADAIEIATITICFYRDTIVAWAIR